jgi:hypothetical protein
MKKKDVKIKKEDIMSNIIIELQKMNEKLKQMEQTNKLRNV